MQGAYLAQNHPQFDQSGPVSTENSVTGESDYLTDTCQGHRTRYIR